MSGGPGAEHALPDKPRMLLDVSVKMRGPITDSVPYGVLLIVFTIVAVGFVACPAECLATRRPSDAVALFRRAPTRAVKQGR